MFHKGTLEKPLDLTSIQCNGDSLLQNILPGEEGVKGRVRAAHPLLGQSRATRSR